MQQMRIMDARRIVQARPGRGHAGACKKCACRAWPGYAVQAQARLQAWMNRAGQDRAVKHCQERHPVLCF